MSTDPSQHGPETLELRFDLDEGDLDFIRRDVVDLYPQVQQQWRSLGRQYRLSLILAIALTLALIVGFFTDFLGMASVEGRPVLSVVLVAGAVGAWWTVGQYRHALSPLRQAKGLVSPAWINAMRHNLGPQSISFTASGFRCCSKHSDVVQRWSGISGVTSSSDVIYIRRRDMGSYIIPKRVFSSPQEAAAAVDRITRWLDEAGHGEPRQIREYIADRDVPCPTCRYNLRGVVSGLCPECGLALGLESLPQAAAT